MTILTAPMHMEDVGRPPVGLPIFGALLSDGLRPGPLPVRCFLKVGSPLTVLIFVLAIVLVPRVWPLK